MFVLHRQVIKSKRAALNDSKRVQTVQTQSKYGTIFVALSPPPPSSPHDRLFERRFLFSQKSDK